MTLRDSRHRAQAVQGKNRFEPREDFSDTPSPRKKHGHLSALSRVLAIASAWPKIWKIQPHEPKQAYIHNNKEIVDGFMGPATNVSADSKNSQTRTALRQVNHTVKKTDRWTNRYAAMKSFSEIVVQIPCPILSVSTHSLERGSKMATAIGADIQQGLKPLVMRPDSST